MDGELFPIYFDDIASFPIPGMSQSEKYFPDSGTIHAIRPMQMDDPLTAVDKRSSMITEPITGERFVRLTPRVRLPSVRLITDLSDSGNIAFAGVPKKSVIKDLALLLGRCATHSGAELQGLAVTGKAFSTTGHISSENAWIAECTITFEEAIQEGSYTDLRECFDHVLGERNEIRSLIIVVSDFISPFDLWKTAFENLATSHSVVAIRVRAPLDEGLPIGMYRVIGAESKQSGFRGGSTASLQSEDHYLEGLAREGMIDLLSINLKEDRGSHLPKLARFFEERNQRVGG